MVYYSPTAYPNPFLAHLGLATTREICKRRPFMADWSSSADSSPRLHDPSRNTRLPPKTPDILIELAEMQRLSTRTRAQSGDEAAVHKQPPNDAHYPFALTRKSRTKPRSSVCVWCIARALLARPDCPALQTRPSGHDADWERWLRDMSFAGMWDALVCSVSPANAVRNVDPLADLSMLCRDLAGSVLECVLRQLRGDDVLHRDLMAQIRSAKYHKVPRVAAMIEEAFADEGS